MRTSKSRVAQALTEALRILAACLSAGDATSRSRSAATAASEIRTATGAADTNVNKHLCRVRASIRAA